MLQGHTQGLTDGSLVPARFWNGIPIEADGSIAVSTLNPIDHYHQGLPFTATGRLVVGAGPVVRFGSGAAPFNAADRLVLIDAGVATSFLAAVGYTAVGEAIATK